jgi:hypothetical protein
MDFATFLNWAPILLPTWAALCIWLPSPLGKEIPLVRACRWMERDLESVTVAR